MAALRGKGCSVLAANTAQAASSPTCALVLSVSGGPSFSTRPASTLAMAKRALVPPMSTATISIYSRDAFLEKSGAPRGDGRQIPAFVPFRVADLAFLRLHRAKKGAWQRKIGRANV